MDSYQSLEAQLRSPIQAESFFQVQGITQQILNNIRTFVAYCRRHPTFAKSMLSLALSTPYSQLEDPTLKTASHAVTEVLCSEDSAIAELFFQENIEDIPEETLSDEDRLGEAEGELQEHELVTESLRILSKPQINETCLGYLQKLFAFLIRHNPEPVLNYFATHPPQLDLLLSNLRYSSISSLVAQLLTSEDRTKAYKHEELKRKMVKFVVSDLLEKVEDWETFDGAMVLVEEILNTTKQSYYEYFEDFKRAANLLVDREVMQRFLDIILDRNEPSFRNAALFLELLFARINSEGEDNSYYHLGEEAEPSMNFQIEIFFENMPALIELVAHIEGFQNLTKISYLCFLEELLQCARKRKYPFSLCEPAFAELLDSLNRQTGAGLYRNKLYILIAVIIESAAPEEISHFLRENKGLWGKYFASIREADYSNTKLYNMNESSAFDVSLIHHLAKKDVTVIETASNAIGKDFKRICKKYETKVASFHTKPSFSAEDEFSFNTQKNNRIPTLTFDLINKNIVIALPNTTTQKSEAISPIQGTSQPQNILTNGIREVQQIEQVIVLTDTISHKPVSITEAEQIQTTLKHQVDERPTAPLQQSSLKMKDKIEGHVDRVRYFAKHLSIFG